MAEDTITKEPACPCCQIWLPEDLLFPPKPGQSGAVTVGVGVGTNDAVMMTMTEPHEAWKQLRATNHRLVDTHSHAHLERESQPLYQEVDDPTPKTKGLEVIALTCAVEQEDWEACLNYASQSTNRIAALGIHPWYLEGISNDCNWYSKLELLLQKHPDCMVGEIGLCKMARFVRTYAKGKTAALALQLEVFLIQLRLAVKYQRPVSIHCVNQQGVLLNALKELLSLPPCIALHSFSGTAHQVQQLLKWEETWKLSKRVLYFGFSHSVNCAMCSSEKSRNQGRNAIRQVPRNRLLAESDVHCTGNVAVGTSGAISFIAWAIAEPIELVADLTTRNGLDFLKQTHQRVSASISE
jgi:Tat protein secretion system quality control protein TatD with DNase activity